MNFQEILKNLETQVGKNQIAIKEINDWVKRIKTDKIIPSYYNCNKDFSDLKILLESDHWPVECVPDTEKTKKDKITELSEKFPDKKVFDWHLDTRRNDDAKHDIILIYDVIDHVINPQETMTKVKAALAPRGQVHVYCHPWTGRQGNHLNTNKAYVHLVFSKKEMEELSITGVPTNRLIHPLAEYEKWFKTAGFKVLRRGEFTEKKIESFFTDTPLVSRRIKNNWIDSYDYNLQQGFHFPPIQIQSVEYVLI